MPDDETTSDSSETENHVSKGKIISKSDFLLHEYDSLREEIVQRITVRYSIITLALAAFGAIFAFTNTFAGVYLEMLYSLLSLFLLLAYIANSYVLVRLARFISVNIEGNVSVDQQTASIASIGWQNYQNNKKQRRRTELGYFGGRIVFPVSSLIAWGVAGFTILAPDFKPISYNGYNFSVITFWLTFVVIVISFLVIFLEGRVLNHGDTTEGAAAP